MHVTAEKFQQDVMIKRDGRRNKVATLPQGNSTRGRLMARRNRKPPSLWRCRIQPGKGGDRPYPSERYAGYSIAAEDSRPVASGGAGREAPFPTRLGLDHVQCELGRGFASGRLVS